MESNLITSAFLPLALAFIMLGMGLSLNLSDFKNIFRYPKAMVLGLFCQLVLLPALGFFLILSFGLEGTMAVGIMIIACCPGGPTSNMITHLSKGDTALSISLTAMSSVITIFTIPLLVNFSIAYFGEEGSVSLPFVPTVLRITGVTLVPVAMGMWLKNRFPLAAHRADRPVRIASILFFVLVVGGAILNEKDQILSFFAEAGPVALLLNILTFGLSLLLARLLALPAPQQLAISIESGIQNGTLGIMIAATLLQNSAMAIPVVIYSLIMFVASILIVFIAGSINKDRLVKAKI
ncbi:bile acid:sodium symporter family protein [Cyclobacterium jeungdonense]|uniref:Bile acid:sodium symporter family protein n=1 Tax=Cyclobacterium jeungdonense TaxID=708087 RepID=A0ABT8CBJ9_9BACT|nr:bile acid:sodium symporter family protein [Cyclobacterium jeungdonense]MDN3689891.1 bile acid:sodium symporter family protein [Cyclobacterium jeungdonense]